MSKAMFKAKNTQLQQSPVLPPACVTTQDTLTYSWQINTCFACAVSTLTPPTQTPTPHQPASTCCKPTAATTTSPHRLRTSCLQGVSKGFLDCYKHLMRYAAALSSLDILMSSAGPGSKCLRHSHWWPLLQHPQVVVTVPSLLQFVSVTLACCHQRWH